MSASAASACQALVARYVGYLSGTESGARANRCSNPEELVSSRADLVKRLFWHCSITETYLTSLPAIPYVFGT